MCVDYESPLARQVAGDVWSGLSRAALAAGFTKTTAIWERLREGGPEGHEAPSVRVFAIGQDRPDAVDAVGAAGGADGVLSGMVEPALLHASPFDCERYAGRLLKRLGSV